MIKSFRLFELLSSDIDYHLQAIKDVFQDVIDDYDLYRLDINTSMADENAFYYDVYHSGKHKRFGLRIFYSENGYFAYSDVIKNMDISKNIKRLENIGYKIVRNDATVGLGGIVAPTCINLDIYEFKTSFFADNYMKYLKFFNENNESSYYFELVSELFQDVADNNNIEKVAKSEKKIEKADERIYFSQLFGRGPFPLRKILDNTMGCYKGHVDRKSSRIILDTECCQAWTN